MLSVGLMSGTSMDGIDAALIATDGHVQITEIAEHSLFYPDVFKLLLKSLEYSVFKAAGDIAQAKAEFSTHLENYLSNELGLSLQLRKEKFRECCDYLKQQTNIRFDDVVQKSTLLHAQAVGQLLKKAALLPAEIDIIGYHGQTVYHRPSQKITHQLGNGKLLAHLTKISVVDTFRAADVAAGGEGAPFAPIYLQALAARDRILPVCIVNCGGIANVTIIHDDDPMSLIGFDTGPGNGLVDRFVRQRTQGQQCMDEDAALGREGTVCNKTFKRLYEKAVIQNGNNFLEKQPPKSLDLNDLLLIPELDQLTLANGCRTLEAFTADTIVHAMQFINAPPTHWVLSGGGWQNPIIFDELKSRLTKHIPNAEIHHAEQLNWKNAALEAQLFAYLAVRSVHNLPLSFPGTTNVPSPLTGGIFRDKSETFDINCGE